MIFAFVSSIAAIAAEKKIQRDTIRKQRDDYIRRASALKRELIVLKEQREELITGNEPPSPTTHSFVKENDRLQVNMHSIRLGWRCCNNFLHFISYKCPEIMQIIPCLTCGKGMRCVLVSGFIIFSVPSISLFICS